MAGAIKGITVQIGADTSKLSKALRSAAAPVNKMQAELRQVEKLLKMNPGNMDLIRQKETLLSQSIEKTKNNLKEMKAALTEADKDPTKKSSAGYRKLQQEILKTEQRLREMVAEQARFKVQSSNIGVAATKMDQLGQKATAAGNKLRTVSMAVGLIGAAAVSVTAEFDSSMAKVQAVSGATGQEFQKLRDKAREMGEKTKFSASESAEAMNYMAMAGWKTKDMLNGIEGIMNLAAASGEDLATTSDIVTDALTALGYAAKDSGHLADVMAAASSNANTNVGMMGETFKYAASVAGAMGYSMEDVALATGLMANSGIKATQAGTSLRSMISRMAAPTSAVAKAMDELGVKINDSNGKARPFRDVIGDLRESMKGMSETEKTAAANTIAGKNAMSGFLAIINSSDKDFKKLVNAIDSCDGAAQEMADTMIDNLGGQVTILKSQLQELAIGAGDTLVPMMKKLVSGAQDLTNWFNGLSDSSKEMVVKMALLAGAAGPALITFGGMAKVFKGSVDSIAACSAKMAALTAIEGETTVATRTLSAATKALPWVAAAAGAALITKAIIDTYKATHEATLKVKEHAKVRQESINSIRGEAETSELYLQKLTELSKVEDKSKSQKQLMQEYVDRLNNSISDLNLEYDEETDKLNKTSDAIQRKIDKMKEEALAAAYIKNAEKAARDYANAEMGLSDAKGELAQKQKEWNKLSESEKQVNGQLQTDIQQLKTQVDDYKNAMDLANQEMNKWNNASERSSDAWKNIKKEAKQAGIEIPQSVKAGLQSGLYTVPESVKQLESLIKFDDMKKRATGDAKETADNLAKELSKGEITAGAAAKKLSEALEKELGKTKATGKKAGKDAGKSYASGTSGQSGAALAAAKKLHSSAQKGASGKLDKQGKNAGKSYGTGISGQSGATKTATAKLTNAAKTAANKPSLLKGIGSSIGKGLAAGMRSAYNAVASAASALISKANEAARAKAKVNSPSKLFRDGVGIAIPEGLAAGIIKGTGMVQRASAGMITAASASTSVSAAGTITETRYQSRNQSGNSRTVVYNIGDVTVNAKDLQDANTVDQVVEVFRRAKAFA